VTIFLDHQILQVSTDQDGFNLGFSMDEHQGVAESTIVKIGCSWNSELKQRRYFPVKLGISQLHPLL
jgi:hypothetical protein